MRMRTKVCYLGAITGSSFMTYLLMKYKSELATKVKNLNQEIHAMTRQMMTKGKQATDEVQNLGEDVKNDVRDLAETLFREIEGLDTKELKVKTKRSLDKIKGHIVALHTLVG